MTLPCKIYAGHHLSYRELAVRAVICDLGTYGDFSIEYDNNNNKSNFDLKQKSNTTTTTNAFRIFLTFTVWTNYNKTWSALLFATACCQKNHPLCHSPPCFNRYK